MKRTAICLACAVAFCVSGVAGALAETSLELLERAQKDLQTHLEAEKKEQAARLEKTEEPADEAQPLARLEVRGSYSLQGVLSVLQQAHDFLLADRPGDALRALQQAGAGLTLPGDVRKDLDAVIQTLTKQRTEREEAYAREVDAACKRAGDVLMKATAPKDLDTTLQELAQLTARPPERDSYNGGEGRFNNKIQSAVQFVNRWQDYLLARSRDNEEAVTQALRNLAESSGYNQVLLVPRSEILARIPQKEPAHKESPIASAQQARPQVQIDADAVKIVQGVNKLEEVPGALTRLVDLRKEITSQSTYSFRGDTELSVAVTSLQNLERTLLEIQNGLATNISLGAARNGDYGSHPEIENALLSLRVQLIKLAVPRLLGASDEEKPLANEGLDAYLRRLIEAAKQRRDWTAVLRGLEIKQTLATATVTPYTTSNAQEGEAFKNFFAGNNLQAAGQYEQAVVSYLTALRTGQADLPAAAIGEQLAAIEKAHPADYASGKEYVLNPPRSPFVDPRTGNPVGSMYQRTYDPRFPGARSGLPGPDVDDKLPVPAAPPASPPVPTPGRPSLQ